MDEATIQALLHVCEGDQVSEGNLVWRTPSVQQSTAMFAHHEGSDFLSITTGSTPFEESEMAGPILWSITEESPIGTDQSAMIFRYSSIARRRISPFLLDIIESANEHDGLTASLAMEIAKEWEDMWKNSHGPLSREKQNGLYGELVVLQNLLKHHGNEALSWWEGPEDGLHDFVHDEKSIEVKTHGKLSKIIKVSNLEQLKPLTEGFLELCCVGISRSETGLSLNELITEIYDSLDEDDQSTFITKLGKVGYSTKHAAVYTAKKDIDEIRMGEITDKSLTLHREKLAAPNPALKDAFYSLDSSKLALEEVSMLRSLIHD